MKQFTTVLLVCCLVASGPLAAQEKPGQGQAGALDLSNIDLSGPGGPEVDDAGKGQHASPAKPLRLTLGHEVSLRTKNLSDIVNNRSWFRIEYSRFFLDSLFVQLDSKLNGYWSNDHRAQAEDKTLLLETNTPEAFLQYSRPGGLTSVKLGIQRLIWGESEAGAITDEVSPRNLSELFFIPLEESRIGQFMATVDHFSSIGDFTAFFVPEPKFNKYPKPGTAYYFDAFDGQADIHDHPADNLHEYGMRWRKASSGSDLSFMLASLIDNDYVFRLDGVDANGRMQMSRLKQRFTMVGTAFNYARGKSLLKGEVAYKSGKGFNDAAFQVVEKNVIDASLGLTYSLGQSDTIGFELVNSHVLDWDPGIVGVPRNSSSLVLNGTWFFLNETLSVNWLTIVNRPYTSYQSSLRTSYKWSDDLTYSVDLHGLAVPDKDSGLYRYRDVGGQVFFRVEYKF